MFQEWFLKNIKLNFESGYREIFFTIATAQNFSGGSGIDMLTQANPADQLGAGLIDECIDIPYSQYFIPRTTYYEMLLLKEINAQGLKYLSGTYSIPFTESLNLQPTMFVDAEKENMYIYYTNTRQVNQNYVLKKGSLYIIYGSGFTDVIFGTPTITCMDAAQLYSRSGKGSLFDMNTYYDAACTFTPPHIPPFEIQGIQTVSSTGECTTVPAGAICISVPATSCGYIKVPITPVFGKLAEEEIQYEVYPNPAENYFLLQDNLTTEQNKTLFTISVMDLTGKKLLQIEASENEPVHITLLPPGVYLVSIQAAGKTTIKKLVKMQ